MGNRVFRYIPALLWMIVIFILSHQTGSELNSYIPWVQRWFPWLDSFNAGHFVSYFLLAILIWWGIASHRWSVSILVVLLCVIYGLTDEYHQSFVPGRTPDIEDIRNDAIGAALAMIVVKLPFIRRRMFNK